MDRMITLAIHTYDKAVALRTLLESEGIHVELNNVNLELPGLSSGVRVRIPEADLALALRIVENRELFASDGSDKHVYLVPVDFSELSFKAACIATRLASTRKARISLLYSYIDPYIASNIQITDDLNYDAGEPLARAIMEQNSEKLLKNFVERLRKAMKNGEIPVVQLDDKVMEGVPEEAIVEYAKELKPALIVMGTRGAEQKAREIIGSITAEVLDEGRFTVLTVPEPADEENSLHPRNILFFSNLDQNDILAMDTVYRLFGGDDVRVTIMHVPQRRRLMERNAGKALQSLSKYCSENFSHYHFVSVPVSPDDCEQAFASLDSTAHFDLIVSPNRHRNAFSRLFNPGLAHKILFQTDVPMLVIPV